MHPKYWKRPQVLRAPADSEGGMGAGGESSQASLVDSFSSFFSDENPEESGTTAQAAQQDETPESAAERLLAEEAAAANQNSVEDGEKKPAEAADDSTVEIEVDGKPVKLTKAELAEHYKNGLRQKDYTQKTMEVSEQRKAADAEIAKTRSERDHYAQQLNNFAITSESILTEQAKALTEDLLRSDPVEYMALERTFRERQSNLAKAQSELQRINGERQQEHDQSMKAYQADQLEKLQAKLPEWKDQTKAKEEAGRIKDYLKTQEFNDQDVAALGDHRLVLMAKKAMQYDALLERAKATKTKVEAAPAKVERPGTTQIKATDGRTSHMRELAKTGSRDAAAKAFAEMFG